MVRLSVVALIAAAIALPSAATINTDASQYFRGDSAGVRNDDGALVVSYAAGRTAESFVQLEGLRNVERPSEFHRVLRAFLREVEAS